MDTDTKAITEVLAVERNWVAAHLTLVIDVISSILADNYRQIQSDGSVIGKAELLESLALTLM